MKKFYMLILFICSLIMLSGCVNSNIYTEEEHYERVKKLVEKRYFGDDSIYESYELYPVYNEEDKLEYFVIDFEPEGYVFVQINDVDLSACFGSGMYTREETCLWQKYQYELDDNGQKVKIYEKDGEGNEIFYNKSPYKLANVKDKKRYLFEIDEGGNYVPAIKVDNQYLDLISMKQYENLKKNTDNNYESINLFFPPYASYDL